MDTKITVVETNQPENIYVKDVPIGSYFTYVNAENISSLRDCFFIRIKPINGFNAVWVKSQTDDWGGGTFACVNSMYPVRIISEVIIKP